MGRKKKKNLQKKAKPIALFFLLITTILIIPLVYSSRTLDPNLAPRMFVLGIVVLIFSVINAIKPLKNIPKFDFIKLIIFPAFGLYLLFSIISMTVAVNPTEGLYDIIKTFLSLALLIFATQIFINNEKVISYLTKAVIISSLIATSIGLYQYFDKVPGNSGSKLLAALYEIKGLMGHKNQFAISLFLMFPFTLFGVFTFKKWWWGLSVYSTLMILLNIVILQTRSVWVATLVFVFGFALLYLLSNRNKKAVNKSMSIKKTSIIAVIIIVVGLGSYLIFKKSGTLSLMNYQVSSLFDSKSHNNQGRLKMWNSTWNLAKDNIVLGVGAGNWKIEILPYYTKNYGANYQNWRRPHNDFLWVLSEKGVLGLVFYLLIFLSVVIYGFKIVLSEEDKEKRLFSSFLLSGIAGYLVIALFTFPLERINHQVYIVLMMAAIVSIYYKSDIGAKTPNKKLFNRSFAVMAIVAAFTIYYSFLLVNSEVYVHKVLQEEKRQNWKLMKKFAEKAFHPLTTIDSYSMPIHMYIGVSNVNMKKEKQALIAFKTAIGYFPTQIGVLNNLANLSAEMGDNKSASDYFNKSLTYYPHYETSLFNYVVYHYRNKDYEKAYIALMSCNTKDKSRQYDKMMKELKRNLDKPYSIKMPD